ncbi:hypothetical protein [Cellulosimicrobium sp. Marseille-Q4280]|uniref:hypothetical protein n=1 Tax=Cellulosimicrobium sp. Marseille-Q4280 TaxID=2937992 RepID=UPI00203EC978|nr:hypothetical protein [Cellulosimicrobium sp. Marseille-Q4280]
MLGLAFLVVLVAIWLCWGWIGRIFLTATTLFWGLGWLLFQGARNDAASADDLGVIDALLWAWLIGVALASALRYRSRRRAAQARAGAYYAGGYEDGYTDGSAR